MIPYQTKLSKLPGSSKKVVFRNAQKIFKPIKSQTKRKPYIRSAYFSRQKVFFDYFWTHLAGKHERDKVRRLKYFAAAVEVLRYSKNQPISKINPNKKSEMLHRFSGLTKEKELFFVQVKENKRSGRKYFMSCFAPNSG